MPGNRRGGSKSAAGGAGEEAEAVDGWLDVNVAEALGGKELRELVSAEAAIALAGDSPQCHRKEKPQRTAREQQLVQPAVFIGLENDLGAAGTQHPCHLAERSLPLS